MLRRGAAECARTGPNDARQQAYVRQAPSNTPRAARASSSNGAAVGITQNPGNAAPARAVRKLAPSVTPKVTPAFGS